MVERSESFPPSFQPRFVLRPAVCRYAGAYGREGFQPFPPYNFLAFFRAF